MSDSARANGSLRIHQLQMRKRSQPDIISGRERAPGEDAKTKTSQSFRTISPFISPRRDEVFKSPLPQRKTSGLDRSFTRSTNLATTASRKSAEKKNPNNKVSSFFRKDYRPNPSRERASPPKQSSPQPLSETVKERFNEINKAKEESKEIGKEALVNLIQKKELATQVQALENRIRKLKQEEELMARKIRETSQKTEKVTTIKKRRMDDLFNKARRKEKETYELIGKKQEIAKKRENKKLALKQSVDESFRIKQEIASNVKQDIKFDKLMKEKKNQTQNEKNKDLINRVKSFEKAVIHSKVEKKKESKLDMTQNYIEKIHSNKEEAESLERQLKDLTVIEEQLVNRLNQTYSIHKTKFDELERLFNLRVSTPNLLEGIDSKLSDSKNI